MKKEKECLHDLDSLNRANLIAIDRQEGVEKWQGVDNLF